MHCHHLIAMALALALAACNGASAPTAQPSASQAALPRIALAIHHADRRVSRFEVDVALDEAAQVQGLQGRKTLKPGTGMLFPFARPRMASFWMQDMQIPLDVIFIAPDGVISAVLPGRPGDRKPLAANTPSMAVLEIAAGQAASRGIAPGDQLRWGHCGQANPRPDEAWDQLSFCPAVEERTQEQLPSRAKQR
jgi:uncharacterized protein